MQSLKTLSIEFVLDYQGEVWDGLKGYLTNTGIPTDQVYEAYYNLWNVERVISSLLVTYYRDNCFPVFRTFICNTLLNH
jgi:hypothetical protein